VDGLLSEVTNRTKIIVVCNPNNPTANLFKKKDILKLIDEFNGLILLDEAYTEYAKYSLVDFVGKHDNLIVLRTFSKAFGLAGIRLGYAVVNKNLAITLRNKYQAPYPISPLAMRVGLKLLENKATIHKVTEETKRQRCWLIDELNSMQGVKAFPSETNFVLFSIFEKTEKVYLRLLERGIIVRKFEDIPGHDFCLRVTVAPEETLKHFLKVLMEVVL
jgi:histidinol-phosphate aminotransferase